MIVLVACEESQEVTMALRKQGVEAYSNDIQDCSGGYPEWHIKGDAIDALYSRKWDLVIAHPPCTYLCNSGVRWFNHPKYPNRWDDLKKGIEFFNVFKKYGQDGNKIAIENPIPHKYAVDGFTDCSRDWSLIVGIGNYTQIIQPFHFGHLERKSTCLWLYNLPQLKETNNVVEEMLKLNYSERAKIHYASPGPNRAKVRSKTYSGIAKAMAEQWTVISTEVSYPYQLSLF